MVGAEVWGKSPVRTIGGCSSVEMAATASVEFIQVSRRRENSPFCEDSATVLAHVPGDESRAPPIECMELAKDPRRGWSVEVEPCLFCGILISACRTFAKQCRKAPTSSEMEIHVGDHVVTTARGCPWTSCRHCSHTCLMASEGLVNQGRGMTGWWSNGVNVRRAPRG